MKAERCVLVTGVVGGGTLVGIFYLSGLMPVHSPLFLSSCMVFWAAAAAVDITYTARYRHLIRNHEQSALLRYLVRRCPSSFTTAVLLTLATEAVLVLGASPFLVAQGEEGGWWNPAFWGPACMMAGAVHAAGYAESRRFASGRCRHTAAR